MPGRFNHPLVVVCDWWWPRVSCMSEDGRLCDQSADEPVELNGVVHKVVATNPQGMADLVANLSWTALDEHDLLEYLQRCASLSVRLVPGAEHASITITTPVDGESFTTVWTDEVTVAVDTHQYAAGEGPCLEAVRTGEVVRVDVATTGAARWPEFAADATAIGVRSYLSAPIGDTEHRVGALNLFSSCENSFDGDDALLTMIVDYAERAVTDYTRLREAQDLVEQLRQAMTSRAPIEQAKGILMAVHRITAEQAFELLRKQSQDTNTKLNTVAVEFVVAHSV